MLIEAKTIEEYLEQVPENRRIAINAVREVVLKNLPKGYEETFEGGMITYIVPLSTYPEGYLDDKSVPLAYAAIASQKNHMAVYLTNIYEDRDKEMYEWFRSAYKASGKRMDVGKSCVRFRKLEDLPLDLIGEAIGKTSVPEYIKMYENSRKSSKKNKK